MTLEGGVEGAGLGAEALQVLHETEPSLAEFGRERDAHGEPPLLLVHAHFEVARRRPVRLGTPPQPAHVRRSKGDIHASPPLWKASWVSLSLCACVMRRARSQRRADGTAPSPARALLPHDFARRAANLAATLGRAVHLRERERERER